MPSRLPRPFDFKSHADHHPSFVCLPTQASPNIGPPLLPLSPTSAFAMGSPLTGFQWQWYFQPYICYGIIPEARSRDKSPSVTRNGRFAMANVPSHQCFMVLAGNLPSSLLQELSSLVINVNKKFILPWKIKRANKATLFGSSLNRPNCTLLIK